MKQPKPSPACFALVREYELCELHAYWDEEGKVWTCGWGSTGSDVTKGTVWTQEQADARLIVDVDREWREMCALVTVPLTQGQVDALTDWTFNLGSGRLKKSSMLFRLNAGDYADVPKLMSKWVFAGKKLNETLQRRRADEVVLWNAAEGVSA